MTSPRAADRAESWRAPPLARITSLLLATALSCAALAAALAAPATTAAAAVESGGPALERPRTEIENLARMRPGAQRLTLALIGSLAFLESALLWRQHVMRRRIEQRLTMVGRRLAFVGQAARLGILELESLEGPVWANAELRRLFSLALRAPLTLDSILAGIQREDRHALQQAIRRALDSAEPVPVEVRLAAGDGPARWVALTFERHNLDQAPSGTVLGGIAREVTDRKHMEGELLKQRQQLAHLARVSILGELSGALAHELNQPLTSILSNAEAAQHFLGDKNLDLDEVRDILRDIVSDDKRAGDVIRRLRALLMRGEAQLQRVEIEQLLHDVLMLEHSDLIARNIRLKTRIPDYLPAVRADRIALQQVLLNLLLNACEAMSATAPQERIVEVLATMTEDGRQVRLSVIDRGRGINPDQLDHIFDPFFTTKREGLGVGLAICRSIITAHAGRIWATNGTDRGAAFHFTVPVFEEQRHEHSIPQGLHR
jgi:C4-dicarboxylate-specific signal transduction histidine kinase